MKFQKVITTGLTVVMLTAGLAGCGKKQGTADGKITISIGDWPDETQTETLETYNNLLEEFEKKYPNIKITPDTYRYDTKTFTMKASAKQLPTMYIAYFTELNKIIKAGHAADITDIMDSYGMTEAINPKLLDLVKDDGGRIYGIPTSAYAKGLAINKEMFREAGLVNEDGSIMIPDTYSEMAEYAGKVKEKTGKAGFVMCTTDNCGGWNFLNIAWSFGVEFMKQNSDGKWEATFDTENAVAALQFVKDLKWKYNALPDNSVIDQQESHKLFGTNQAAMTFEGPSDDYSKKYGMEVSNLLETRMPAGEYGRYAQMGGGIRMFASDSTPEQIDACFKWLDFIGAGKEFDEVSVANKEKNYQTVLSEGGMVLDREAFPVWVNEERVAKEREIAAKYTNIDPKDFESYYNFEDVILKPEEPVACQQLYSVLDGCIQAVITDEKADCKEVIKNACHDFQVNHLDKEN